ncbi:tail fibers protein [Citrobacter phage SH5]|uniref:Tail fibers protein n=2 Tax=Kayfunavirus SH4 TaxID=2733632 RepID=A0A172JGL5_9CAUD|nr:tail fiber protein [Citrobacter phage SH4]AMR59570.1 tail fibers protein [Citrobacter phage SH4]AMR59624.1 tail fibers protein [Citrobacter phage SH5]
MANTTLTQFPAGQTQYKINFDYLARPFVVVTLVNSNDAALNRVLTAGNDYLFLNPTTIEILTSQAGFDILQIHRFTSTDLLVDFRDGSVLTATDLTNSELQAIHIAEEGRDQSTGLAKQYADQAVEAGKDAQDILNQIILLGKNGYTPVGSFENGGTVRIQNDVLQYGSGTATTHWRWEGTLPKVVPAGSTPTSAGGIGKGKWIDVTDATLRGQLAGTGGASMVKASDGRTVEQWLVQSDSASYRAKNMAKLAWVDYQVHNRGSIKSCFLGDSMTAGFDRTSSDVIPPQDGDWATRASMNYPYRFASYLAEQSGCTSTVVMRAISGHTAKQAYEQAEWQTNPNCDIVFIMYAINDSGGVAGATLDIYMEYMEKLIRRYIDWGCAVVVQRPSGGGQGAGNPRWLHWAKRLQMVARVYGCPIFDAHEVMFYRHYAAVQSDGTHYNSMGYAIHGEKLASMLMAGGLLDTYRPVVNEITVWTGMMSDRVGWCDAMGNIGAFRSDGAFTRTKITGRLPGSTRVVTTFSFYLDAEAAHIYGKFLGKMNVIMTNSRWWNNNAQPYYQYADDQPHSFGMSLERTPKSPNDFSGASGSRKFIGRVIGRGWHTLTFFKALDGTDPTESFINSLTIQPIPLGLSTEQMWGQDEERRYKVVHTRKLPSPSGQGNNLPQATTLSSFHMRVPQSVLGTGPGVRCLPTPYFYNTIPATLRITDEKGTYIEFLVYKNGSSGLTWTGKVLKSTLAEASYPTLTAQLATAKQSVVRAAGQDGTNMPLENIYDFNGGLHPQNSSASDISWRGGIYFLFTLTWPGTAPTGYWNIELEGSDWFGNSESSFGAF